VKLRTRIPTIIFCFVLCAAFGCSEPHPVAHDPLSVDACVDCSVDGGNLPMDVSVDVPTENLWLSVVPDGEYLDVQIWAKGLGQLFGIAGRVEFNDALPADASIELEDFLGGDGDAAYLVRTTDTGAIWGGTRKSRTVGATELNGPTLLGALRVKMAAMDAEKFSLTQVSARRADGSVIAIVLGKRPRGQR